MALTKYKLGDLIYEIDRRNSDRKYGLDAVRGISNNKEITPTKASVTEDVIAKFYVIKPGEFIYNPRTTRMGEKVGMGFNDTEETLLFSFYHLLSIIAFSTMIKPSNSGKFRNTAVNTCKHLT